MAKAPSSSFCVETLNVHYGQSHVLQGISLDVPSGEITAIVGRNGVGKTTLINTIMGILKTTSGKINLKRKGQTIDLAELPAYSRKKMGIALVPQGRRLFSSLSVEEHLALVSQIHSGPHTIDTIYKMFPSLYERRRSDGNTLSGGEQSMLAIARALILNPEILLMDEPTEGLAPLLVGRISEVILELKSQGLTVLLVEQKLKFALDVANRLAIMARGKITGIFPRDEISNVDKLSQMILSEVKIEDGG